MSYHIDNLFYSLSKRIPNMERGFSISTDYGEIHIDGEEGRTIITATRKLLERKLAKAEKVEAARSELARLQGGAA